MGGQSGADGVRGEILANRSTAARRALDFYSTPPDVTHALMRFMLDWREMTIWEPAAGDRDMANVIAGYSNQVYASDIATGKDFLTTEPPPDLGAIVTNPPFNLSEEFIRRALLFTPNVAMLLKSQYWHAAKRLALFRETRPAYVLPLTWRPDFAGGGAPTMEVLWTVWEAEGGSTRYIPLERP
jgi:hypothetical protein